jgi:hypothetical protein
MPAGIPSKVKEGIVATSAHRQEPRSRNCRKKRGCKAAHCPWCARVSDQQWAHEHERLVKEALVGETP